MTSVEIDPNIRVRGNQTRVGLEDASGPLEVGMDVMVLESESGLSGPGRVLEIDTARGLVFLEVEWSALRAA